jgi:hypothetical protein
VFHLFVSDLRQWWDHIVALDLGSRYDVKTRAPQLESWGVEVAGVIDPFGVLWRIHHAATAESRRELVGQTFLLECLTLAWMVIEAAVAMRRLRWQSRQRGKSASLAQAPRTMRIPIPVVRGAALQPRGWTLSRPWLVDAKRCPCMR